MAIPNLDTTSPETSQVQNSECWWLKSWPVMYKNLETTGSTWTNYQPEVVPDWTAICTIKSSSISSGFFVWLAIGQGAILVSPPQVRRFAQYYWPNPRPENVQSPFPASACPTHSWRQHAASKWSEPQGTIQLAQGPKFQNRVKIQNDDNFTS